MSRGEERDDRFIWWTVKTIADKAGVKCHTHALRAAFAVYYLETHQRDTLALQSLLGHRSGNTTQIYLRKLDRQAEMERVRDLSWGVPVGESRDYLDPVAGAGSQAARTSGRGEMGTSDLGHAVKDQGQGASSAGPGDGTPGRLVGAGSVPAPGASPGNTAASENSQIADVRFDED